MFLTREEVNELTGRRRRDAQAMALRFMGIEHKIRPDGSLAVLRAHVEEALGHKQNHAKYNAPEPNWNAL